MIEARPTTASLTASHRLRVMVWFHTNWWVPVSSSRPISGAPQNMPISAGAASRNSSVKWNMAS